MRATVSKTKLSEADRLNGIQWSGKIGFKGVAMRYCCISGQALSTEGPLAQIFRRHYPELRVEPNGAGPSQSSWTKWEDSEKFFWVKAITREDGAAFRIVPAGKQAPTPTFGSGRGLIEVGLNFDDPIEDLAPHET